MSHRYCVSTRWNKNKRKFGKSSRKKKRGGELQNRTKQDESCMDTDIQANILCNTKTKVGKISWGKSIEDHAQTDMEYKHTIKVYTSKLKRISN